MQNSYLAILLALILLCSVTGVRAELTSNREGRLDREYGANGIASVPCGSWGPAIAGNSISSQSGDIFHGNASNAGTDRIVCVTKQLSDGTLDPTFAQNGLKHVSFTDSEISSVYVQSLAQQADGKLLVAGIMAKLTGVDSFVLRLMSNGDVDLTFGNNGVLIVSYSPAPENSRSDDFLNRVLVDGDGKIVTLSLLRQYGSSTRTLYSAVSRFDRDGMPDGTFGKNGTSQIVLGSSTDNALLFNKADASLQGDGKIIAGLPASRESTTTPGTYYSYLIVCRYLQNGNLDSEFSEDGITEISPSGWEFYQLRELPNGRILTLSTEGLVQLNGDGTRDLDFGWNGHAIINNFPAVPNGFVTMDDGKILVSGSASYPPPNAHTNGMLVRLWPKGTQDIRFASRGQAVISVSNSFWFRILGLRDQKYLVAACFVNGVPGSVRIFARQKP